MFKAVIYNLQNLANSFYSNNFSSINLQNKDDPYIAEWPLSSCLVINFVYSRYLLIEVFAPKENPNILAANSNMNGDAIINWVNKIRINTSNNLIVPF